MKREKKIEKGASGLDMYTTCHVVCEKQHRGTRDHTRLFELFSYKYFVSGSAPTYVLEKPGRDIEIAMHALFFVISQTREVRPLYITVASDTQNSLCSWSLS